MDILNNVQKAVKDTIKTLENAGGGGSDDTIDTNKVNGENNNQLPSKLRQHNHYRPPPTRQSRSLSSNIAQANHRQIVRTVPLSRLALAPVIVKRPQLAADGWRPAEVRGAIYGNKILHFKDPIRTTGTRTPRSNEWVLNHFFSTGEAICRFCFKMASGTNDVVFVVSVVTGAALIDVNGMDCIDVCERVTMETSRDNYQFIYSCTIYFPDY